MGADAGDRKIGVSDNPFQRLAAIRYTAPDGCRVIHATNVSKDAVFTVERVAHKILRLNRTHGEWFDVTAEAAIAAVASAVDVLNVPAMHVKGEDLVQFFHVDEEKLCRLGGSKTKRGKEVRVIAAVRVTPSLKSEAEEAALAEGRSLSQWTERLIAERLTARRTAAIPRRRS